MHSPIRSLLLFAVMLIAFDARAQSEPEQLTETAGSVSGHVTLGGRPAPGVKVLVFKQDDYPSQRESVASVKTDQYGHFQLSKLPSDRYYILPYAPAYISSEQVEPGRPGKIVPLAEGEVIKDLDFALTRGSVITGRITDENGQPVTGERVTLAQLDSKGQKRPVFYFFMLPHYDYGTDDQGIYRILGLPPGRYLVSAGKDPEQGGSQVREGRYHSRTFYPGVTDESKAGIVVLAAGAEATGIDITFGASFKTYSASGRVIDANTGRPLPKAQLGYGMIHERRSGNSTSRHSSFSSGLTADERGNFRLDGLLPGTFYVLAMLKEDSGQYSPVASFEIKDQDITGLEIKVRSGSSVSGVVAVEGVNDPEITAKLSQLTIWASVTSPDIIPGAHTTSRKSAVSADGGFQITGLHPGKVSFFVFSTSDTKGFFISRVERGGVAFPDGIEVGPGEQVAPVRVILGYASGRIRGQLKVEGGKLPPDAQVFVSIERVDGPSPKSPPQIEVDPNGRFVAEDLVAGEYEISVNVYPPFPPSGGQVSPLAETASKKIAVTNGSESQVLLVVKLIAKDKDQ